MPDERRTTQVTDHLAVIGKLREVLLVACVFHARRDRQVVAQTELELRVGLVGRRDEAFVEVRQRGVHPAARIGRRLVAVARRVLGPESSFEDAQIGRMRHRDEVAHLPVRVQLVGGAGRRDRGRAVVVLLVVVPHPVGLVVERPAVAKVRVHADVLEVRGDMVEVEPVVQRRRRVVRQQEVVAVLGDLRPRGALLVRRVAVQIHHRGEHRHGDVGTDRVLQLRLERLAVLDVERLIPIGRHLVAFDQQPQFPARPHPSGVELRVVQLRVERPERHRSAHRLL